MPRVTRTSIRTAAMYLLAGAIVSTLLGIGVPLVLPMGWIWREAKLPRPMQWQHPVPAAFGPNPSDGGWSSAIVCGHTFAMATDPAGGSVQQAALDLYWCGWPFRMLRCEFLVPPRSGPAITTGVWNVPARFQTNYPHWVYFIPTTPIWPGLIGDCAFNGLLVFGLVRGPRVLRRRWRIRHGRCPWCAYPRAADTASPCPECGQLAPGKPPAPPVP